MTMIKELLADGGSGGEGGTVRRRSFIDRIKRSPSGEGSGGGNGAAAANQPPARFLSVPASSSQTSPVAMENQTIPEAGDECEEGDWREKREIQPYSTHTSIEQLAFTYC